MRRFGPKCDRVVQRRDEPSRSAGRVPISGMVSRRACSAANGRIRASISALAAAMVASNEQLVSWMQRHGHEISGPPREIYWIGPTETDDPNSYETEVIWLVR